MLGLKKLSNERVRELIRWLLKLTGHQMLLVAYVKVEQVGPNEQGAEIAMHISKQLVDKPDHPIAQSVAESLGNFLAEMQKSRERRAARHDHLRQTLEKVFSKPADKPKEPVVN